MYPRNFAHVLYCHVKLACCLFQPFLCVGVVRLVSRRLVSREVLAGTEIPAAGGGGGEEGGPNATAPPQ